MAGILFIISAPSGSGKSTLVSGVRSIVAGLEFSVSYTTRSPRGSEVDGEAYHFTTRENFEAMIARGEFLEYAEVFGNYYGTARSALDQARKNDHDLLLDIDVQGAMQVMEKMPEAVSIFILPPSPQVLEMRLRNRSAAENMRDESVIQRRLTEARNELQYLTRYKYAVVNDVLDQAITELRAIVVTERGEEGRFLGDLSQSCRTSIMSDRLKSSLVSFTH
ncbi:guanylate kinase [Terriglobus tenax]|uniref:guanylate kinase n=1 Tax=Terriglobus tenax TaxID=1111115 RepID=UPI0021DF58C1|nr:guanylate kinase [Terriglobus tenax]